MSPELADPVGAVEVREAQEVDELGASRRREGLEAPAERASISSKVTRQRLVRRDDSSRRTPTPGSRRGAKGRTVLDVSGYPAGISRDIVAGWTYTSSALGARSRTSCARANISSCRRTNASSFSSGSYASTTAQ
jgi:hypothetical protein